MKIKLTQSRYLLPIGACLLVLVLAFNIDRISAGLTGLFTSKKLPLLELAGKTVEVSQYQYLGSWPLPDGFVQSGKSKGYNTRRWRDTVRLTYDDSRKTFQIDPGVSLLKGSVPQAMTPDSEAGIYNGIQWRDNQVSLFAFRARAPSKQVAVLEIDTDGAIALYINGRFMQEVSAAGNVELGTNLLIPVDIEAGENVFTIKAFSSEGPPRLRMALILDQSRDAQAAWNRTGGFLGKLIYKQTGDTFEAPVVTWDARLNRMTVGAEVHDVLNGKSMFKMDAVRRGDKIMNGGRVLGEGIYRIIYKSPQPEQEQGAFEEIFLVGDSRKMADSLTRAIEKLPWSADERLNVEAQLRRVEILFKKESYKPEDREWGERVLFTLGNLAEFINLKVSQTSKSALPAQQQAGLETCVTDDTTDIFTGLGGLRLRGFVSKIDNSTQFYRLFVPSHHTAGDKLPVLVIMHTPLEKTDRPFLESPFVTDHRTALEISKFAEKHGFAVLWPGYRSAPRWWTYEFVHVEEALEDVEKHCRIDPSRVSLYGTCEGGIFAGRMASIYPNRFAAIVYDRAYFDSNLHNSRETPDSAKEWIRATNPSDKIIANTNIKIFVLNDGSRGANHGEIAASREFLGRAQAKRSDIKSALGPRAIGLGLGLWNSIFDFLAGCKNERPDPAKVDVPAASGYAGPISEIFATPFLVVEGTRFKPEEARFMETTVKTLMAQYQRQFYNAKFILKKDTEITDEDIEKYSLVLVGNAESNAVWGRLAAKYGAGIAPYEPPDDSASTPAKSAFAEVFKNPVNKSNYLLLIGANELKNMALLRGFDPCTAWFDSYVREYRSGRERTCATAHRP